MDSRHRALLEKYWQAETSIKEEQELLAYLQNNQNEDGELTHYFSAVETFRETKVDLSDEVLMQRLIKSGPKSRAIYRLIWAVAASIILLFGLRAIYPTSSATPGVELAANPETSQALALTSQMLMLVSTELNKMELCTYPISEFGETMDKIKSENKEL